MKIGRYAHMKNLHHILEIIYNIYYKHSSRLIKRVFSPILIFLKFRILYRIKHLYLPIYFLHGKEKSSGLDLKVLFFGNKISLLYITNLLFQGEPNKKHIGKTFFWKIDKFVRQYSNEISMVFISTDRFFQKFLRKKSFIVIPGWVDMTLQISDSLEKIEKRFKKSAKEDIRVIKKFGYAYEITNDENKFDMFFNQIRLPYLVKRHGELAIPDTFNYNETKDIFERGRLLLIKHENIYLSGALLVDFGRLLHLCYMGVREGSHYFYKGAGAALYYYSILWAKENSLKFLDFGSNRPFLNDGSLQYKRKWGANIQPSKRFFEIFGIRILKHNDSAVHYFLKNNPFPFLYGDYLNGLVFLPDKINFDEIDKIQNEYYTPGLKQLYLVSIKDDLKQMLKNNIKKIYDKLKFISMDDILDQRNKRTPKTQKFNEKDVKKIKISVNLIGKEEVVHQISEKTNGINNQQLKQLIESDCKMRFEKLAEIFPDLKDVVLHTFLVTFAGLKRENLNVENIDDKMLISVFSGISKGKYSKEAIPMILKYLLQNNTYDVGRAIDAYGLRKIDLWEIEKIIEKIIDDRKELVEKYHMGCFDILMGSVMKELHGKADGTIVSRILEDKLKKFLNEKK